MTDGSPPPEAGAKFADAYVETRDGLRLHYRDYAGNDAVPPLLCLPGLTRNARDFERLAARHAGRFRVIAIDFRGRALSDRDPRPERYTPLVYAHDVVDLLDRLALGRAIFIGTSLGGVVTMLVAALARERIAGAVLNDVRPELDRAGLDRIRDYVGADQRFANWDDAARQIAANSNYLPAHYRADDWARLARRLCREEGEEIRFDYDPAIAVPIRAADPAARADLWPMFRALAAGPLLVLRGGASDLLSGEALLAMAQAGATTVTIPGVGHAPDLEEPVAVAAIEAFLGRFA